jgi:hypothetical protein
LSHAMTRNQAGLLKSLLAFFAPPRPPSKSRVRRWNSPLTPKVVFRVTRRRKSDVEAVTDNLLAENRDFNATAPGYRRRSENPRKLRRVARLLIAKALKEEAKKANPVALPPRNEPALRAAVDRAVAAIAA